MKKTSIPDDYIIKTLEESKLSLQATSFGFERCYAHQKPYNRKIRGYSLLYVLSGKGYIQYPCQPVKKISSGEIFILFPTSENTTWFPDKSDPWSYIWIDFTGNDIPNMFRLLNISKSEPSVTVPNRKTADTLAMNMLRDCLKDTLSSTFICTYYCYGFFAQILNQKDNSKRKKVLSDSHIKKAQKYIEENYPNPDLNIQDVSNHCALNKVYFSRLFVKETGVTFSAYLMDLRIRSATNLFKSGNYSVKNVSYSVGFSSPYYFSKMFKKFHTISPKVYIDELKNISEHLQK